MLDFSNAIAIPQSQFAVKVGTPFRYEAIITPISFNATLPNVSDHLQPRCQTTRGSKFEGPFSQSSFPNPNHRTKDNTFIGLTLVSNSKLTPSIKQNFCTTGPQVAQTNQKKNNIHLFLSGPFTGKCLQRSRRILTYIVRGSNPKQTFLSLLFSEINQNYIFQ